MYGNAEHEIQTMMLLKSIKLAYDGKSNLFLKLLY